MVKRKGLPQVGELVICTVNKLTENAAWCKLEEYPNLEGMIHVSEAATRIIYDIKDALKVGKQYVTKVLSIDEDKKQVNLSIKRVSKADEKEKLNQYKREQRAENILNQIANYLNKNLDEAYEKVGFLLQEKFGDLYVAFDEISKNYKILDKLNIDSKWKDAIINVLNKIFVGKKVLLKAELDIRCYAENGINLIKDALSELEKNGFVVKYISAPKYIVEIETNEPKKMEKRMVESLEKLVKFIKDKNGEASYKFIQH
jgi:translation initiation factor 2 subunit 1